jgi:hypothetical protein
MFGEIWCGNYSGRSSDRVSVNVHHAIAALGQIIFAMSGRDKSAFGKSSTAKIFEYTFENAVS